MLLGVSSICLLNETFNEALDKLSMLIEEYDLKILELFDDWTHNLSQYINEIRNVKSSYNLKLVVHAPVFGINIANPNRQLREKTIELLKESMINAKLIEAENYIVHPGSKTAVCLIDPNLPWRLNLESAHELQRYSEDIGLRLSFENMPTGKFAIHLLSTSKQVGKFLKEVNVDLTFDVGHAGVSGEIYKFIDQFKTKIVHVHVHENRGKSDAHLPVGSGNVDWMKILKSLNDMNLPLVVENLTLKDSVKSIINLRKMLSR